MRRSADAIAPVVAVLLILAAIVTLLSIYNSGYMPQMKEEAEIAHLKEVGSSFKEYVTYIENSAREKKEGTVSIPVTLGGGDTFLSPTRSGGALSVSNCTDVVNVSFAGAGVMKVALCSLEYETVGNFWHERGYNWSYGIVNITEFQTESPVNHAGMDKASEYIGNKSGFPASLVDVDFREEYQPVFDAGGNFTGMYNHNCSEIDVDIVRIQGDPESDYVSGNGDATISINTGVSEKSVNCTQLNFSIIDKDRIAYLKTPLMSDIKNDLDEIGKRKFYNIGPVCTEGEEYGIMSNTTEPLNIRVRYINITIGVR